MSTPRNRKSNNGLTEIVLPKPHSGQQIILDQAKRFNVVACGRRFGKTILGEYLLIMPCLQNALPVAWFAPTYASLLDVWREITHLLEPITLRSSAQEKRIELVNGGIIDFWSLTDPDSGRGRKYARVIVDEAAISATLEQSWSGTIRPTLADFQGDAYFLSTPKGKNYFWRLFLRGADELDSDWIAHQMPSWTNPHIPRSEFEAARNEMPELIFAQEILASFVDESGGVFRNIFESVEKDRRANEPYDSEKGYCLGVDLARVNDFTVITVLDTKGKQVYFERFKEVSWELQMARIRHVADLYCAGVIIDSTGAGQPIYEFLKRQGLTIVPFHFTAPSKMKLIDNLSMSLEQNKLDLMDIPEQTNELLSYEYKVSASGNIRMNAPGHDHDDCVIGLALACWGISNQKKKAHVWRSSSDPKFGRSGWL